MKSCLRRVYAYQIYPVVKNLLLTYVAALRPQGDGRVAERWNRCRKNGHYSALCLPQPSILKRGFVEKYVQLPEVEYGRSCISFEMYQDNLASKDTAPSKLYHLDLKDYQGRLHLKIPKRNPIFAMSGNRRTY